MSKTILITGGTGYLGRNLGSILKEKYHIVLSGRNNKQNHCVQELTSCLVIPMDVTNIESVRDAFAEIRPDIIIHAAATKYVDLSEKYPMECVDINVTGSQNVARVAIEKGVDTIIGMSTDKAAPPVVNTYGLSKALMERVFCAMNGKTATKFACVRHGNIAWSTGSFLNLWRKMLKTNGVIQSTGPDMTRYISTVEEAVKLVITAFENIDEIQGGILSCEMKSVLIRDVADSCVKLSRGRWEQIEGRSGEREHEYLMGESELAFTRRIDYSGAPHYLTTFNKPNAKPLKTIRCSLNAERLTEKEILEIINNAPNEEI